MQENVPNDRGSRARGAWTWVLLQFVIWLLIFKVLAGVAELNSSLGVFFRVHILIIFWVQLVFADLLYIFTAYWCSSIKSVSGFMEVAGLRRYPPNSSAYFILGVIFLSCLSVYGALHGWAGHNLKTPFLLSRGLVSVRLFHAFACTMAPICEEVTERGFVFPAFRDKYGLMPAILISCCLDIFYHQPVTIESGFIFCGQFAFTIVMCLIRERTSSTWTCIIAHSLSNAIIGRQWWWIALVGGVYLATVGKGRFAKNGLAN